VNPHVKAAQLELKAATGDWFAAATVTLWEIAFVALWLSVTVSVTV
jgi:hypothetical protein